MPEVPLDPSIALVNPNFYSAALKTELDAKDALMLEQHTKTYLKAKSLLKLSEKEARKQFLKLDPLVQNNIRYIFSDKEIFQPEQGLVGKAVQLGAGAVQAGVNVLASPLIAGLKAAGVYGKVINTPNVLRAQSEQGKEFSKKLLTDSYNGLNSWRWDKIAAYEKQYGRALTTLLRGNAEGRTIGESMDMYGTSDADMYKAIQFMGDEPEKFENLLTRIKLDAQVSPGRDFANRVTGTDTTVNRNHWAVKFTKKLGIDVTTQKGQRDIRKYISGPVDAIYQLAIDPLSYIGISPAVKAITRGVDGLPVTVDEAVKLIGLKSRGERMADTYQLISEKAGTASAGMDWAFRQPEVKTLWDNNLGPKIKNYMEAESPTVRSMAFNQIKQEAPQWANREFIRLIGAEMKKTNTYDSTTAKNFFTDVDDFNLFLSGPVTGISARRNGIPAARTNRNFASAAHRIAYETFNPAMSSKATEDAIAQNDAGLISIMDALKKVSDDSENLLNPEIEDILKLNKDVQKTRKIAYSIGTGLSRSPGRILWGDDAIKTIEDVRNLAQQVMPTNFADAFAEAYTDETADIQLTMIRNLYQAFMLKAGMSGDANGIAHMEEILSTTFNEKAGMFSTTRSEVPLDWVDEISPNVIRYENDIPLQSSKGIIQPSQIKEGIAPLPYDLIYQYGAQARGAERTRIMHFFGGVTRNNIVRKYQDFWANYTLFPRSGQRSGIDEMFFHFISAPFYNVRSFILGKGYFPTRALTSITGSKASQGMYTRGLYKLLPKLDPTKKFGPEVRAQAVRELAELESKRVGYTVPESEVSMALIREDMAYRAQEIYEKTVPPDAWANIRKLMKHNPVVFESMINSLGSRASISGKIDIDFVESMFTPSNMSKMMNDFGLEKGKYSAKQISKMSESAIAVSHFDNYGIRLSYNRKKISDRIYLDPAKAFYENNGLKTKTDFVNARNQLMKDMGVEYSDEVGGFVVTNKTLNDRFLSKFSTTVYYRQQGLPEESISRVHIENMLLDIRNTFHGGPNSFNSDLLGLVNAKYDQIVAYRTKVKKDLEGSWSDASSSVSFAEFETATVGRHPVSGEINTRFVSNGDVKDMAVFEEEGKGIVHFLEKYGELAMEVMDATVTGMYRQKALWIAFDKNLKDLVPYEAMLKQRQKKTLIEQGMNEKLAEVRAADYAEKRVVETAWKDASERILEYVDNPAVKSNFAIAVRSVGRFYRATEDFQRRVFRLYTKTPLRTLYRMRLLHTGLEAAGDIYEDPKGEKYIVFPTDTIINSAIEPVVRALTGNKTFSIPTFNDITLKLRLINPSFAPDAGQPALSGPVGAVSTMALRSLLRNIVPVAEKLNIVSEGFLESTQPTMERGADIVNQIGLGNFADSMTFRKAITPMLADTLFGAVGAKTDLEWDRQASTAVLQAMAYFQANGYGIDETATEAEKTKYINNLKIAVSNIYIAKTLLGYISPGMPAFKESKDLPNYMKKVGITSFKAEFWDIYGGILRNSGDDVANHYDLAVATFIGKNPGKIIWTVPRTEKEFKVLINQTDNLKNWSIDNKPFIDKYKEIAYVFAPKAGDYNSDVYNFLEAADLIKLPELEDYLLKLQIAEDKEAYFEIGKQLEDKLSKIGFTQERSELIKIAADQKRLLVNSNPYLEREINGSINDRGAIKVKFKVLNDAINDKKTPVDTQTRKAMRLILEEVASFVVIGDDMQLANRYDFSDLKEQKRAEVEEIITTLANANPAVAEANRLIFKPLLSSYSREALSAGPSEVNR
jgi:hypothetical protein